MRVYIGLRVVLGSTGLVHDQLTSYAQLSARVTTDSASFVFNSQEGPGAR